MAAETSEGRGVSGALIGRENREAVRRFFLEHIGCSHIECAKALGLSVVAVGRHVARLREEWEEDLDPRTRAAIATFKRLARK